MEKNKPFGIELVAALSLIGAVYTVLYTDRSAFVLFQAGLSVLAAVGLWLGQTWGWWAAMLKFLMALGFSVAMLALSPRLAVGWVQLGAGLLPLIYLLLPGVRLAMGVGRKA